MRAASFSSFVRRYTLFLLVTELLLSLRKRGFTIFIHISTFLGEPYGQTTQHSVFNVRDQRHDCMGWAGHPFIDTPAMDRLANEGIRFANGFTAIPLFAPSRASHLSGVYPHTHGAAHNRAPINPDLVTWPEQLQKAGYRTGFFGKVHYGIEGIAKAGGDPKPGFDRWVSFRGQGDYEDPVFIIDGEDIQLKG